MDKDFWGYVSVAVSIAGYIPYLHSIMEGKCKPHIFSWIIWSWVASFMFVAQLYKEAGAGAWVTGATAALCLVVTILSLRFGDKEFTNTDEVVLGLALAAMPLWVITKNPLFSVLLLVCISILGFFPTFRKSRKKPYEEDVTFYTANVLKFLLGLLALEKYSIVTISYPLYGIVANGVFVAMLLWRRRQTLNKSVEENKAKAFQGEHSPLFS